MRKTVWGTQQRPRLCVFRSHKHVYAQIISDENGKTLVSASTISGEFKGKFGKVNGLEKAKQVGTLLAKLCKEKNIARVIFDRNGYLYHGQVKALADAAREGGLVF